MAENLLNRDNLFGAYVREKWFADKEKLEELLGICFPRGRLDPAQLPPEIFNEQRRNFLLNMADLLNGIGQPPHQQQEPEEAPPIGEQVQEGAAIEEEIQEGGAAVAGEGEIPEEAADVAGEEEIPDDEAAIEEEIHEAALAEEEIPEETAVAVEEEGAAAVVGEEAAAAVVEEEAAQVEKAPVNVADKKEFPPLMRYARVSKKEKRGEFNR